MRCFWAITMIVGLALSAAALRPSAAQSSVAFRDYTVYEGASLARSDARMKRLRKPIALKDIYDRLVTRPPRDVLRLGKAELRKYALCRTQGGYGSDLIYLVPRKDAESMAALDKALPGDKVLAYGKIAKLGTIYVFVVEKLYRGHKPPKVQSVKVTLATDPKFRRKRSWLLAEPGKTYIIRSPYDAKKPIYIRFQRQ